MIVVKRIQFVVLTKDGSLIEEVNTVYWHSLSLSVMERL
jgi:hypothetical protein